MAYDHLHQQTVNHGTLSQTYIYARHITRILTEFTGFYRVFVQLSNHGTIYVIYMYVW